VYIESAEPGDVLKVRINKIVPARLRHEFQVPGMFRPIPGPLPGGQVKSFYLDLDRKVAEFAPGIEISAGALPGHNRGRPRRGPVNTARCRPAPTRGNLDIRDLVEGTTLYVPVFVKARCCGRAIPMPPRATAEVNLTALETAYKEMSVTVEVLKTMKLDWPRI